MIVKAEVSLDEAYKMVYCNAIVSKMYTEKGCHLSAVQKLGMNG